MVWHTVKVGRSDEGDVDTEVSVVGRAVEAQIDAEWHRRPRRVLLSTVKAYLLFSSAHSSWPWAHRARRTLLACFDLSFSKTFCDCNFVADIIGWGGQQLYAAKAEKYRGTWLC